MAHHIGYIHGSRLEPFSPPGFCQSAAGLEEYTYYYQKGYRQMVPPDRRQDVFAEEAGAAAEGVVKRDVQKDDGEIVRH